MIEPVRYSSALNQCFLPRARGVDRTETESFNDVVLCADEEEKENRVHKGKDYKTNQDAQIPRYTNHSFRERGEATMWLVNLADVFVVFSLIVDRRRKTMSNHH